MSITIKCKNTAFFRLNLVPLQKFLEFWRHLLSLHTRQIAHLFLFPIPLLSIFSFSFFFLYLPLSHHFLVLFIPLFSVYTFSFSYLSYILCYLLLFSFSLAFQNCLMHILPFLNLQSFLTLCHFSVFLSYSLLIASHQIVFITPLFLFLSVHIRSPRVLNYFFIIFSIPFPPSFYLSLLLSCSFFSITQPISSFN